MANIGRSSSTESSARNVRRSGIIDTPNRRAWQTVVGIDELAYEPQHDGV